MGICALKIIFIFVKSSETVTSSAGEQLARDSLDDRQKCQSMGTSQPPIDIFRGLYALKTHLLSE
jgi:hypothetical protein